jgi:pre-mRNA-processing factor SLU7
MSYCSGQAGIEATKASVAHNLLTAAKPVPTLDPVKQKPSSDAHFETTNASGDDRERTSQNFSKKRIGEGDVVLDKERLAQAIGEEKKRKMKGEDEDTRWGSKKKMALGGSHDVTEEELGKSSSFLVGVLVVLITSTEAYRMSRRMGDDPMANYADTQN